MAHPKRTLDGWVLCGRRGQKAERNRPGRVDVLLWPEKPPERDVSWKTRWIWKQEDWVGEGNTLITEVALPQRPRANGRRCPYRIGLPESTGEGWSRRPWSPGDGVMPHKPGGHHWCREQRGRQANRGSFSRGVEMVNRTWHLRDSQHGCYSACTMKRSGGWTVRALGTVAPAATNNLQSLEESQLSGRELVD